MSDDEITVPATEPDPPYVDTTPAEPDDIEDVQPMQAGEPETDGESETASGVEP